MKPKTTLTSEQIEVIEDLASVFVAGIPSHWVQFDRDDMDALIAVWKFVDERTGSGEICGAVSGIITIFAMGTLAVGSIIIFTWWI